MTSNLKKSLQKIKEINDLHEIIDLDVLNQVMYDGYDHQFLIKKYGEDYESSDMWSICEILTALMKDISEEINGFRHSSSLLDDSSDDDFSQFLDSKLKFNFHAAKSIGIEKQLNIRQYYDQAQETFRENIENNI